MKEFQTRSNGAFKNAHFKSGLLTFNYFRRKNEISGHGVAIRKRRFLMT